MTVIQYVAGWRVTREEGIGAGERGKSPHSYIYGSKLLNGVISEYQRNMG